MRTGIFEVTTGVNTPRAGQHAEMEGCFEAVSVSVQGERSVPNRFDQWPGVLPKVLAGFGVLTRLFGFSAIGIALLGEEGGLAAVSARAGEAGAALSRDALPGIRDRAGSA